MLVSNFSIHTALRSLQSAYRGDPLEQGADHRKDGVFKNFLSFLKSLFDDRVETKIQSKTEWLERQGAQIFGNIIHAKQDDGSYLCTVWFGDRKFSLTQGANSTSIEICDCVTEEKLLFKNATFPVLQEKLLRLHLGRQHDLGNVSIDLTTVKLSDVNLENISFDKTVLSRSNFNAILAGGGDLTGATLQEGEDITNLSVARVPAGRVAEALISVGANSESILQQYFSILGNNSYKVSLLKQYLNKDKDKGNGKNSKIDLSKFNLNGINCRGIDFTGTLLSRSNFNAIFAGCGNLIGASLHSNEDVTDLNVEGCGSIPAGVAKNLIKVGANFKSVLISLLNTESCLHSDQHKAELLKTYLEDERKANRLPIDLSEFNLNDVNLDQINFNNTVLSQTNLKAIFANCRGNLSGAKLAADVIKTKAASKLYLYEVAMDKSMASQLISAGADPKSVLINYLATERGLGHTNIDISGLDLTNVHSQDIDLRDVEHHGAKFQTVPDENSTYEQKIQANFQHDLLKMLAIYSETVAQFIQTSTTQDKVINLSAEQLSKNLESVFKYKTDDPNRIKTAIELSTGNCYDMALMCKSLLDSYLLKSLELLGYQNVKISTHVMGARYPADHCVVKLECSFQEQGKEFLVDPWSNGKAWTYKNGMDYFRARNPDKYTNQNIVFGCMEQDSSDLEKVTYQQAIQNIFDTLKVKVQLDSGITRLKPDFLGFPKE